MARDKKDMRIKDGNEFVNWLKTWRDGQTVLNAFASDKLTDALLGGVYKGWAANNGVDVKRVSQDQKDWVKSLVEDWASEEGVEQGEGDEEASEDDEGEDFSDNSGFVEEGAVGMDGADAEDDEEASSKGSVVNYKYRKIYRDAGHPDNCGDWLATELEGLCHNADGFDFDAYTVILDHNAVEWAKYATEEKKATRGWQGRLRMTTRAILQRKVAVAGKLNISATKSLKAPADWVVKHLPKAKASSAVIKAEKEAAKEAKAKAEAKPAKEATKPARRSRKAA
jgi:hypothetical protein